MTKQNPFSLYDFLGYLIPGALVVYSYLLIEYYTSTQNFRINELLDHFSKVQPENIFLFIIASYSLGHLLSFSSSITVERYAVWKYDFPSKYLLGFKHKGYWNKSLPWKSLFWRSTLIIILLPCIILDYILGQFFGMKEFYQKSLDPFLSDLIRFKINKLLVKLGVKEIGGYSNWKAREYDFHRIITHYTFETLSNISLG